MRPSYLALQSQTDYYISKHLPHRLLRFMFLISFCWHGVQVGDTFDLYFQRCSIWILAVIPTVLTKRFHGFHQPYQRNAGIVHEIRPWLLSLSFPIHHSWNHPTIQSCTAWGTVSISGLTWYFQVPSQRGSWTFWYLALHIVHDNCVCLS